MKSLIVKSLLAFVPGGQVVSIIGSVFGAIGSAFAWVLKWLFADIADGFKEPQRFIVRIACMLVVFVVGGWSGINWQSARDAETIAAITKQRNDVTAERDQWRKRHDEQETRAASAEKAGRDAESRERALVEKLAKEKMPAISSWGPAAVERVRARPAAATAKGSGPGLFGFPSLFGGGK